MKKTKSVSTRMKVDYFLGINENKTRQESFWYYDYDVVAEVKDTKTNMIAAITPMGQIQVQFEEDGKIYCNDNAVKEALKKRNLTDKDIRELDFIENNWYEIRIYSDDIADQDAYNNYRVIDDVGYTLKETVSMAKKALKEYKK